MLAGTLLLLSVPFKATSLSLLELGRVHCLSVLEGTVVVLQERGLVEVVLEGDFVVLFNVPVQNDSNDHDKEAKKHVEQGKHARDVVQVVHLRVAFETVTGVLVHVALSNRC